MPGMRDRVEGGDFVTDRAHYEPRMTSISSAWEHMKSQNATLKSPPDPPRKLIWFEIKKPKAGYSKKGKKSEKGLMA